ncbi:MAG: alpha/beta fold hydrolase [Candidatus Solibacter sp.]|nr:alpha/beta fold hydrolase [Candidatus Solibacter sp.]
MLIRALRILPLLSILLVAQPAQDSSVLARKALDLVLAGQYAEFLQMSTADVQKGLPVAELAKVGATIKTYGAVEKIGDPAATRSGPNTIVVIPTKFAAQNINFRFIVNSSGLVAGFFQLPGGVNWQRPEYSQPDSFKERAVTVGEDEWKLPGTLTVPVGAGPFPAVVLVHGSGPNDRDETVGGTKVFKDLAEGLASRGIVVLRYEKRTLQYRARIAAIRKFTVQEETVEDAVRAVALVRSQPEVNGRRVFVAGHSLGGYSAPRIAEEDGKLAGLVLLAGNARPLEDLLVEQVIYMGITGQQLENAKALQANVKKLEASDEDKPPMGGLPASYWVDLKEYDPAAAAKKLGIPMLILQGERDYQVTMTDFARWKTALTSVKGVVMKSYTALNHLFVAGEGKSMPAEYSKPGHVAPAVIEDIAKFVK